MPLAKSYWLNNSGDREGEFEVIRGNRLAFAARRLGWNEIEENINPCDSKTAFQLVIESNMDRIEIDSLVASGMMVATTAPAVISQYGT